MDMVGSSMVMGGRASGAEAADRPARELAGMGPCPGPVHEDEGAHAPGGDPEVEAGEQGVGIVLLTPGRGRQAVDVACGQLTCHQEVSKVTRR